MKIGEIADLTGISISTLRYYDKNGLFPHIKRDKNGIRVFSDADIQSLKVVECLKVSGMKIKDIQKFMEWCQEGDTTLEKRLNLFRKQEMTLKEEIEKLQKSLAMIQYKKKYYTSCLENKK